MTIGVPTEKKSRPKLERLKFICQNKLFVVEIGQFILKEVAEVSGAGSIVVDVLTETAIFAVANELLDGEGDFTLGRIDADNFGFVGFANLNHRTRFIDAVTAEFGDVDETFNAFGDLSESTEFSDLGDFAIDDRPRRIHFGEGFPRISGKLFDTEGEAFGCDVDVEDDGFDFVVFVIEFGRVADFLCPADVGDMDETVDAVFDADEETEIGNVADFALDDGADGIFLFEDFPGIGFGLFHAEANFLGIGIEGEDDDINDITDVDNAAGMFDTACPGHFGDVDEAFDAFFEFNERTVIDEGDDAAEGADAGGISFCGMFPGIRGELFVAEGNAFVVRRELEDFDLDFVADLNDFVRMIDTAPAHVGDVEETVDAAEVNECTVFGDVLDDAVENGTFVEFFERLALENCTFFFEKGAAGKDDVSAFFVELDNFEAIFLADEFVEIASRTEFDLAAGEECADADINGEATLDAGHDGTFDGFITVGDFGDFFPDHEFVSFFLAENTETVFVFGGFDIDIDCVADFDIERTIWGNEFGFGNLAFRFITDINDNKITYEIDNFTTDDFTFTNGRLILLIFSK